MVHETSLLTINVQIGFEWDLHRQRRRACSRKKDRCALHGRPLWESKNVASKQSLYTKTKSTCLTIANGRKRNTTRSVYAQKKKIRIPNLSSDLHCSVAQAQIHKQGILAGGHPYLRNIQAYIYTTLS